MGIEILTLSPDGTVELPEAMRKGLYLTGGDRMVALVDRDSILLKPIRSPSSGYLRGLEESGDDSTGYSEEEMEEIVGRVVKEARRESRT